MDHQYIKNRDIVLFSFQPWETDLGSNFKDIALELSKNNRVLYFNRALDRASLWRKKKSSQVQLRLQNIRRKEITPLQQNLWLANPSTIVESINWLPVAIIHDLLNKLNNRRLAKQINKIIRKLEFTEVILINDNDFIRGRYLKKMVHCTDYIFYKRDYMLGVGYFQRHGPRLEAGALRSADMVVTNSEYLARQARPFNQYTYDMGQGCDTIRFVESEAAIPADLLKIGKPLIGYTGYISAWRIDLATLVYIAEQLPGCQIVLAGPVDPLFDTKSLSQFDNVHFLGLKEAADLPSYIQQFDICINPQVLNEITRGNYPRKVDEYLAMGKPVVATATDAMMLFADHCMLCKSKEAFVEFIRRILANPEVFNSEEIKRVRRALALGHSWKNSVGRLGDAYFDMKSRSGSSHGSNIKHAKISS